MSRSVLRLIVLALLLAAPLSGCGKKGDLYLPDREQDAGR